MQPTCSLLGTILFMAVSNLSFSQPTHQEPMQGVPPSRESQVTMANYRDYPASRWAFRNTGAPMHAVMIPRGGHIRQFAAADRPELAEFKVADLQGKAKAFDQIFKDNYADGLVIAQGQKLLHESYFGDFSEHDAHIWFSMSKSLASTAFGLLVDQGLVDLQASPAKYIPELVGSGFERVSIQQVLDHGTSIDFHETYTNLDSDFARYYAPALNMGWMPGAADVQPDNAEIYGVHDFLGRFIKPDPDRVPGDNFDYNSANADVLGWLIARLSGQPFQDYIEDNIWSKIGAEHDAYILVDRAYMPAVTGGMNSTARDALRFGMMVRDRGEYNGQRIIPASWIDATLDVSDRLLANMQTNTKYQNESWSAYHNMWWILDAAAGEYCAVGIHGQVIYINRRADTVMVWFSSQPGAASPGNANFRAKLQAARQLAVSLSQ
jgi:CubicO group peptidase (beta-lactamase class C family)